MTINITTFTLLILVSSTFGIPVPDGGAQSFVKQNGEDAIALNNAFASLTAGSSCTPGTNACINDNFAQCVGGKFVLTSCGAGTICVALPLVNKQGTSITCSTAADRDARIAATGATGAGSSTAAEILQKSPNNATPAVPGAGVQSFVKQNGEDAISLNNAFASLAADSSCTEGADACVNDKFAQCVGGKFVLTPCGEGTICVALPLVNKQGTSITCSTAADRDARIAATGATDAGSSTAAETLQKSSNNAAPEVPGAGAQSFAKQNGEDAIALNNAFVSLTADSSCTEGADACVNNKFAQCVGGKFVLTPCGEGTICVALPLVNKPGTSITCSTAADRDVRIAATGATGTGGSTAADSLQQSSNDATVPPTASDKPFTKQNGLDAQALNKKFATLSVNSACQEGENACIGDVFAQCANGKFVTTSCAGGLRCAALPLVNSPGTSITCVDTPQAIQRIAATGAGNSLTGN